MAILAQWGDHTFAVDAQSVMSFKDLVIKSASTTKDKTSKAESYVTRKSSAVTEVTMKASLYRMLGIDVKAQAMLFADDAKNGVEDFLYVGEEKLLTCMMMLVTAQIEKIEIGPNGEWLSCEVGLTFKQSTKFDGTKAKKSSGGSSKKKKPDDSNKGKDDKGDGNGGSTDTKTTETKTSALSEISRITSNIDQARKQKSGVSIVNDSMKVIKKLSGA